MTFPSDRIDKTNYRRRKSQKVTNYICYKIKSYLLQLGNLFIVGIHERILSPIWNETITNSCTGSTSLIQTSSKLSIATSSTLTGMVLFSVLSGAETTIKLQFALFSIVSSCSD